MTRGRRSEFRKGEVIGLWTVLSVEQEEDPPHRTKVSCRCKCGRIAVVRGSSLGKKSGSCGVCTRQARGAALGRLNAGRKRPDLTERARQRKLNGTGDRL